MKYHVLSLLQLVKSIIIIIIISGLYKYECVSPLTANNFLSDSDYLEITSNL